MSWLMVGMVFRVPPADWGRGGYSRGVSCQARVTPDQPTNAASGEPMPARLPPAPLLATGFEHGQEAFAQPAQGAPGKDRARRGAGSPRTERTPAKSSFGHRFTAPSNGCLRTRGGRRARRGAAIEGRGEAQAPRPRHVRVARA